jgi:hypothetical protein
MPGILKGILGMQNISHAKTLVTRRRNYYLKNHSFSISTKLLLADLKNGRLPEKCEPFIRIKEPKQKKEWQIKNKKKIGNW